MLIDKILTYLLVIAVVVFELAHHLVPHLPVGDAEPEPVLVPACSTMANAGDAAAQLRARLVAGAEVTDCDLQQFDHVVGFIGDWEDERGLRSECENTLTECEWGWWDAAECTRYQEASRIEDAIDAIYSCAEASER